MVPEIEPVATSDHGSDDSGRCEVDEVSLTQHGATSGTLRVNLRWRPAPKRDSGQGRRRRLLVPRWTDALNVDVRRGVDLDIGCLFQFTDGRRGVIQAVGRRSGDYARAPYIRLDRDDRVGTSAGENIFINMDQSAHFQRILIFVMLAGGRRDLTKAGASVTIHTAAGPLLEFLLEDSLAARARSCAVAQIHRKGPEIVVRREMRYFTGYQSEIDSTYDWGLRWGPGPGKPRL